MGYIELGLNSRNEQQQQQLNVIRESASAGISGSGWRHELGAVDADAEEFEDVDDDEYVKQDQPGSRQGGSRFPLISNAGPQTTQASMPQGFQLGSATGYRMLPKTSGAAAEDDSILDNANRRGAGLGPSGALRSSHGSGAGLRLGSSKGGKRTGSRGGAGKKRGGAEPQMRFRYGAEEEVHGAGGGDDVGGDDLESSVDSLRQRLTQ